RCRGLAPAHAGREPLDTGVEEAVSVEARIQAFDSWIGIAVTRLPATERSARKRHRGDSVRRPEHVASRHLHRRLRGLSAAIAMNLLHFPPTPPPTPPPPA